MRVIALCVAVFTSAWLLTGCTHYKNIAYFQDLPDSIRLNVNKPNYEDLLIAPDDILSINIQTIDPAANAVFNQGSPTSYLAPNAQTGSLTTPSAVAGLNGFLVSKDGSVEIPLLGMFHLAGLTTMAARDSITARAAIYYKTPVVNVRFANFKVTVLGEVLKPGSYIIPNERASIFDALGLAGDLTIYGKRENVLLIRDSANQNKLIRLNLNSKSIVQSDYFYLRKNDVVYVEPNKAKLANLDASQNRNFAIIGAGLSVLIILASRIK